LNRLSTEAQIRVHSGISISTTMNLGEWYRQFIIDHPMPPIDGSRMVDNSFTLQLHHKQRWGWVIYRTDYSSEENWTKFLKMFATWTTTGFPPGNWVVGQTVRSWQQMWWMDDKTKFENASLESLHADFRSWLAAQNPQSRQITFPEHYMFLLVDREVLQDIQHHNPGTEDLARDELPYIKAYDADLSEDDPQYPGWMKVELTSFYALYHEGMKHGSMRALRSRYSEWFDEDVLEEETYLVEESDSDEE
ncbi:hypothetical protein KCU91_g66, partial [Aureobasidium melanogenum]